MATVLDITRDRFAALLGDGRGGEHAGRPVSPEDIGPESILSTPVPFRYGTLRLAPHSDGHIYFSGEAEVNRVDVRLNGDFCGTWPGSPVLRVTINRRFSLGVAAGGTRVSPSAQRKLREELTTMLGTWTAENQSLFVLAARAARRGEYEAALSEMERIAELQATADRLQAEARAEILA